MNSDHNEETCRNCGTRLKGPYCHHCGQSAQIIRKPFRELASEVFSNFLQWDSRLFHTLRILFLKPGKLTTDWTEGKRARHVPPFRLYLLASLLLFLLIGFKARSVVDLSDGIHISESTITQMEEESEKARESGDWASAATVEAVGEVLDDPGSYVRKAVSNLPKAAFLLLPVFGLILEVLNIRRNKLYIDYIVFSLHFHSFVFLLFSLIVLLDLLPPALGNLSDFLVVLVPVYLAIAFKNFHEQSWMKSIFKACVALGAYGFILLIAITLFFAILLYV